MGCDIHLYKEKFVDGKWVAADKWVPDEYEKDKMEVPWEQRFTARNYELFGLLSQGVRSTHPYSFEPRGMPFDACEEVKAEADNWDSDGHSHSYLFLHELKSMAAYLERQVITIDGMMERKQLDKLQKSIDSGTPDWDLLFPYCKSTNAPNYVYFKIDVPALFYVGDGLREIIKGFDGIDGDNHRIVFFFDN